MIYRKLDVEIWSHPALAGVECRVTLLLVYLLTGPHTTSIPGLFRIGRAALAEALGWEPEDFASAWRTLAERGLVQADWHARLVWVPLAWSMEAPANPSVVKGWRDRWATLPKSDLLDRVTETFTAQLHAMGSAYETAFVVDVLCQGKAPNNVAGNGGGHGGGHGVSDSALQRAEHPAPHRVEHRAADRGGHQEQEQEQKHTHTDRMKFQAPGARAAAGDDGVCVSAPPPSKAVVEIPAPYAPSRQVPASVTLVGEVGRVWRAAEALLGTNRGIRLVLTTDRAELVDAALSFATPEELIGAMEGYAGCPFWRDKHLTIERVMEKRSYVEEGLRRRRQADWSDPRPGKVAPVVTSSSPLPAPLPPGPRKSLEELNVRVPWEGRP